MAVETFSAAFLAGLGTGAHCAFMCGPLACALRVRPAHYHLSRLTSYSALGALLGAFGHWMLGGFRSPALQIAPWLLLAGLVALALGLDRRLPLPAPAPSSLSRWGLQRHLGWLTPILPCGPLWWMLATAAASGSATEGCLLLLSFGAGTTVLYLAAQTGLRHLQAHASRRALAFLQPTFLWFACALLLWRLWKGGPHGCCTS
jgi:sulfite exporter TauE/SafE